MVSVKSFMVPIEKFITIDRDAKVRIAAEMMRDNGIGSIFVTTGDKILGILTDTDLVRRIVAAGMDPAETEAGEVMSSPILTIDGDKSLLDANDLMAREHIRHLGVTQKEKIVGMISVRDLVVFLTNLPRK